ncbi:MAG: phosphoesterase [Gammaproteobacteria bacterium RIFCSPHIGHO2_02_FULL_42_13]|nr:MAG: phosphoesterase [Gammaproteobacteria bacterium RIFCSPHIGHO2_02_FULL_42_13]OGT69554.1 MAG: phosphoesterase [Gammaproteobacteria bacterium RIFCSPLOWO2_02_FULL_42_9]
MPDLSTKSAHEFWKNYEDKMIYRVISFMESVENWTLDGQAELENALNELGQNLEGITKFELANEQHYVKIGCHLKMSRVLRILQAIDSIYPGSASRVLMHAEEQSQNQAAQLFLRRNIVFERLRLLSRVFSKERFELVAKAMENENTTL